MEISRISKRLKVTTTNEQVHLVTTLFFISQQSSVNWIEFTMTTTFYRNIQRRRRWISQYFNLIMCNVMVLRPSPAWSSTPTSIAMLKASASSAVPPPTGTMVIPSPSTLKVSTACPS